MVADDFRVEALSPAVRGTESSKRAIAWHKGVVHASQR